MNEPPSESSSSSPTDQLVEQEYKWVDGPDCEHLAPSFGLELTRGVLSRAAAAGRNKDHVVAVVDVRLAHFHAEPLPNTFVELLCLLRGRHQARLRQLVDAARKSLGKRCEKAK